MWVAGGRVGVRSGMVRIGAVGSIPGMLFGAIVVKDAGSIHSCSVSYFVSSFLRAVTIASVGIESSRTIWLVRRFINPAGVVC